MKSHDGSNDFNNLSAPLQVHPERPLGYLFLSINLTYHQTLHAIRRRCQSDTRRMNLKHLQLQRSQLELPKPAPPPQALLRLVAQWPVKVAFSWLDARARMCDLLIATGSSWPFRC